MDEKKDGNQKGGERKEFGRGTRKKGKAKGKERRHAGTGLFLAGGWLLQRTAVASTECKVPLPAHWL